MSGAKPKIALFVLEALPNARAVRRFVADHAEDITLVGLSNAERASAGGLVGQIRTHLSRSGPGFFPYLAINFALPDLLKPMAPLAGRVLGNRNDVLATPLARLAERLGIPTITVDDVNGSAVAEMLRRAAPDLIVTFHFDQILSAQTIAAARLGGLNVHPSLLPRHRGPVPTIHAMADGLDAFGVTVLRLVPKIDAGANLAQETVAMPSGVTATRAAIRLHEHGRVLLETVLADIAATGRVPDGEVVSTLPYCPFPDRAMLAAMRRRGLKLTDRRDLRDALALHTA